MMRKLLVAGVVVYGLIVAIVWAAQRSFLYFPTIHDDRGAPPGWVIDGAFYGYAHVPEKPAHVWLFLHGNGGQASDRTRALSCFAPEDAVYLLEYPGYGPRVGEPSEESINAAARAAYRTLVATHPNVPIGIVGESLGSGPACVLAKESPTPGRIVLIVPFANLPAVAAEAMPFIPARWLLRDRWDNVAALAGYQGPVRIYAAEEDRVIPNHHAKALAAAQPGATLTLLEGGHNGWASGNRVRIRWD